MCMTEKIKRQGIFICTHPEFNGHSAEGLGCGAECGNCDFCEVRVLIKKLPEILETFPDAEILETVQHEKFVQIPFVQIKQGGFYMKSVTGAIISAEEYFKKEIAFFIEDCEIEEHENPVEKFKDWINEDSDYTAINDNGDEIKEMTEEQEVYYNGCFNAAIEEIKKYFRV